MSQSKPIQLTHRQRKLLQNPRNSGASRLSGAGGASNSQSLRLRQQTQMPSSLSGAATLVGGGGGGKGTNRHSHLADKLDLHEAIALAREGLPSPHSLSKEDSSSDEDDKGVAGLGLGVPEASSDEEMAVAPRPSTGAVEVPLVDLPLRLTRHTSNDFEIIPHQRGVIALDEGDFPGGGRAPTARRDSATASLHNLAASGVLEDSEAWEILEVDEEPVAQAESPKTKSWSRALLSIS